MKWIGLVLILLAASLLLGCGGQAPAQPSGGQPSAAAPAQPGATTPAGAGEPATTPPGNAAEPAATGDTGFDAIAAKVGTVEYKATYSMLASGQTMTTVQVMKGTKKRIDTTAQGQTTSMYVLGDNAYICMNAGGSMMCYSTTAPAEDTSTTVAKETAKYTITPLAPRTVVGMVGSCWSFMGEGIDSPMESCYTAEGVLLYSSATSQGQTIVIEATSVQIGNVADSEFTLPAEPTALPSMGDYGYGG